MKKYTLILMAALLTAACTTPEEDAKIHQFWMEQYIKLMGKMTEMKMKNLSPELAKRWDANALASQLRHTNRQTDLPAEVANEKDLSFETEPAQTQGLNAQPQTQPQAQPRPRRPMQKPMMDVTFESDAAVATKAPEADRARIQRALEGVQAANQKTLTDIETAFGPMVKDSAFALTAHTEKQLKNIAAKSTSWDSYFAAQKKLLATQNQKLNQLMLDNSSQLRNLK